MGLLVTGLIVAGGAVGCDVLLGSAGDTTEQIADIADVHRSADPADPEDIGRIQRFGMPSAAHVELGEVVAYNVHPPVGGDHYAVWQDCGVYDEPVRTELAVHSQEHGAVWITYDESEVDEAGIETLTSHHNPGDYLLISPMTGLPAPVVASAWGAQLVLEDPEDPVLVDFLREFDRGVTTPEHGGPCSGSYGGTEVEFEDDREELESLVDRLG